ncbi:ferrochelatase [Actinomyces sp. W5033]|uniref:ferrochelatase n=1 Tax=Actinomyces sp. W5033 TaxID=3446479 RepID=UPI003EDEEDB8
MAPDATAHTLDPRPALVIANLGTPATPTAKDVRPYLREFLSDRRVVEMHPLLWRPILETMVLIRRPADSAAKYRTVWREGMEHTRSGSPLMHYTERQVALVQEALGQDVVVRAAMRYGDPGVQDVMRALMQAGHRRIALLPAYPQYSASSQAPVVDEAMRFMLASRNQPELRTVRSFPTNETYIEALAAPIEAHWAEHGRPDPSRGEHLLCSFHSIPAAMHAAGDPYRGECEATVAALAERLGVTVSQDNGADGGLVLTTFQSVFGRAQWIGPATIDTVEALGRQGCQRLDVICPGFMSDCLETLEEIDQLNRKTFTEAGGGVFTYLRWGNDSEGCARTLVEQAQGLLSGWL